MTEEDVKMFSNFLNYFQKESDRGTALIGAAMVESRLNRILEYCLVQDTKVKDSLLNGGNAPLGTFSAKNKICYSFGFITKKEYDEINQIRQIRNKFAHELMEMTFSDSPVKDFCLNLNAETPDDYKKEKKYRDLYINSVILTSMALWYRPEYINKLQPIKTISCPYQL